jgi:hypothetical protein
MSLVLCDSGLGTTTLTPSEAQSLENQLKGFPWAKMHIAAAAVELEGQGGKAVPIGVAPVVAAGATTTLEEGVCVGSQLQAVAPAEGMVEHISDAAAPTCRVAHPTMSTVKRPKSGKEKPMEDEAVSEWLRVLLEAAQANQA